MIQAKRKYIGYSDITSTRTPYLSLAAVDTTSPFATTQYIASHSPPLSVESHLRVVSGTME